MSRAESESCTSHCSSPSAGRLHGGDVVIDGIAQNMDEVIARFLEQVRVVDRETALGVTQDEHVGKAVYVHPVHGPHSALPVLGEAVAA